ncbi:hypothetical protein YC2023_079115 [Brassica napus]
MGRDLLSFNIGSSSGFKADLARQKATACSVGNSSGAEWCSSQCVHSSCCKENRRLSSWCLLAVEIGFKSFESRSFWFEEKDSSS